MGYKSYELYSYLRDNVWRTGWKPHKTDLKDAQEFIKRIDGVWFILRLWPDSVFDSSVWVLPSKPAVPLDDKQRWDEAWEATHAVLDANYTTLQDIEAEAQELARVWKEYAKPSQQARRQALKERRESSTWRGYEGQAALEQWRLEIERLVLEWFARSKGYVQSVRQYGAKPDWSRVFHTSREVWLQIVEPNTGSYELGWPSGVSRDRAAKAFRAILDNLAKTGQISRETGGENVEWGPVGV